MLFIGVTFGECREDARLFVATLPPKRIVSVGESGEIKFFLRVCEEGNTVEEGDDEFTDDGRLSNDELL